MYRLILFISVILLQSVGFPAYSREQDFPRKGEGIYAFLRRHNREGEAYYAEFMRLNKGMLGEDKTLRKDVKYTIPPEMNTPATKDRERVSAGNRSINRKVMREPLFGKDYEYYNILDNSLAGADFYLVSGHGGPDCGAIANVDRHQLHEDEYAYDIILRLARNLLQHGATVHIIIQDRKDGIRDGLYLNNSKTETCMGKEIPLNQKKRLKQRTDRINKLRVRSRSHYQRAIFVHLDSRSHKQQLDVFFYYQNGVRASLNLAENMRKTFSAKYEEHQPGRGFSGTVTTRSLAVLNNTVPASIFVELANMQNINDQKRYIRADNRQALANWLALGFMRDYKDSK
ncbi:MAG: N-acetylmuramoyl-L-alanine amidase [Dysgonamonadaceae bacterium]|jgi:N-acetylmuramoyl-L-alanine amidase|nr:N-acetylmuramoyl-L-alanine amidase [Dysgonamonadaceae bacterium]